MSTTIEISPNITQHNASDAYVAAQVIAHDDGTFVVRFGYADTTIRDHRNPLALPKIVRGQFEEAYSTPSRVYRTRAGADRAVAKWCIPLLTEGK